MAVRNSAFSRYAAALKADRGLACQAGAAKRRSFSSGVLPAMKSVHSPVSLAT
ncbi:hypothetical protein D3C87_2084560 [compost metagenome]